MTHFPQRGRNRGPYLDLATGGASTPDTADMFMGSSRFRLSVRARVDTATVGQFPSLVLKTGGGGGREAMLYVFDGGGGALANGSFGGPVGAVVDTVIAPALSYGVDHDMGVDVTPGSVNYVSIFDGVRTPLAAATPVAPEDLNGAATVNNAPAFLTGRLYSAECVLLDAQGVSGRVLWRFAANDVPPGTTVYTDPRGRVWTLTGTIVR